MSKNENTQEFFKTFRRQVQTQSQRYGSWRQAVRHQWKFKDLPETILSQNIPNQLEKHIALQACCLSTSNLAPLLLWKCQPWAQPHTVFYPLSSRGRISSHTTIAADASIDSCLRLGLDDLASRYASKFDLSPLGELRELSREFWDYSLIGLYQRRIDHEGFKLLHSDELGEQIILDVEKRIIALNWNHYQNVPGTHVFHRTLRMLKLYKSGLLYFLALDPIQDIHPILKPYLVHQGVNLQQLCSYWNKLWDYLNLEQMAETLDLVGLVEESLNTRIFAMNQDELREKMSHRRVDLLLKGACSLIVA